MWSRQMVKWEGSHVEAAVGLLPEGQGFPDEYLSNTVVYPDRIDVEGSHTKSRDGN